MKVQRYIYLLLIIAGLILLVQLPTTTACTVITATSNDVVLFGYNEDRSLDQFDQLSTIKFIPATNDTLGYMAIIATEPGIFSLRVGMNERGVVISGNGLEPTIVTPHPERPFSWRYHSFYNLVLNYCSNISQVKALAQNFDFGSPMGFQAHIADSSGAAIVVSPGADGEIAITEKTSSFLISTNENREAISEGAYDARQKMATGVIEKSSVIDHQKVITVLDAIHQEGPDAVTYYSTIFDLTHKLVYLYLVHDFTKEVVLNISEEMTLGEHSYNLSDLFVNGQQTLDRAEQALIRFQLITTIIRILAVALVLLVTGNLGMYLFKNLRNDQRTERITKRVIFLKFIQNLLLIGFILVNASLLPVFLLTNFVNGMMVSGTVVMEFVILVGMWLTVLFYVISKGILLLRRQQRTTSIHDQPLA